MYSRVKPGQVKKHSSAEHELIVECDYRQISGLKERRKAKLHGIEKSSEGVFMPGTDMVQSIHNHCSRSKICQTVLLSPSTS